MSETEVVKEIGASGLKEYIEKLKRLSDFSMRQYCFHTDTIDLKNMDSEIKDFYKILISAIENEPDFPIPSFDFVKTFAATIKEIGDSDIIGIARRNSDNAPLAFVAALPNYNEILIKMGGRLFPFGFLKFVLLKKKIKSVRVLLQFCIPEYRNKGAIAAVYHLLAENALSKGYTIGEASTIEEQIMRSWKSVKSIGGTVYRTYRYYYKAI